MSKRFIGLIVFGMLVLFCTTSKPQVALAQSSPSAQYPTQRDRDECGKIITIPLHFSPNDPIHVHMEFQEKNCQANDGSREGWPWDKEAGTTDPNGNLNWESNYGLEGTYSATFTGSAGGQVIMTLNTDSSGAISGFTSSASGSIQSPQVQPTEVPPVVGGETQNPPNQGILSLDLSSYCLQRDKTVGNDTHYADGWYCLDSSGVKHPVVLDDACNGQYGGYEAYIQNWDDWFSIGCVASGGNASSAPNRTDTTTSESPTDAPVPPTMEPTVPFVSSQSTDMAHVRIVADVVNIRDGEGKAANLIAKTRKDNTFSFIEQGRAGWFHIQWDSGSGWVSNNPDLTIFENSSPPQPTTELPTPVFSTEVLIIPTNTELPPVSADTPIPPIVPTERPQYADAQSGNGVHWGIYCSEKYQTNEYSSGNDPLSWGCGNAPLEHNQVCLDVWGPTRQYAHHNLNELGSMTCESTSQDQPNGSAPVHPDAQTNDGGIDVDKYCKDIGYEAGAHSDAGVDIAYSNRCVRGQEVYYLKEPEFNQACHDVWGGTYFAELQNADMVGGWKCVQNTNAYVDPGDGRDPHATTPTPQPPPSPVVQPPLGNGESGGYTCPPSMAGRLTSGGQGKVLVKVALRSEPGTDKNFVADAPAGTIVSVISVANCYDGANWWKITYGAVTAWLIEGKNGTYYVEPYKGSSQLPPNQNYENVNFSFQNSSIVLKYNSSTNEILNGDEFIGWELGRLLSRIVPLVNPCPNFDYFTCNSDQVKAYLSAFNYTKEITGEVEDIRHAVQNRLCADGADLSPCAVALRYVVGNQKMDMSGPGNVVFGYVCEMFQIWQDFEDTVSNSAQTLGSAAIEHKYFVWYDYPDDVQQRLMGHNLYKRTGGKYSPTVSVIAEVANATPGLNRP